MRKLVNLPASLLSCSWLQDNLARLDLIIIDCSWYLPNSSRDGRAEYLAGHIPGAHFYDLEAGSDPDSQLPHTVPSAAKFSADMRKLGINKTTGVVVYDGSGQQFSAARLWWQLRLYGHDDVALLDGGLPAWQSLGLALSSELPPAANSGDFVAEFRPQLYASLEQMQQQSQSAGTIIDARGRGRFNGSEPEPRASVASGHIPGSCNMPYASFSSEGLFLAPERLRQLFAQAGIDLTNPQQAISCTCGSGVTACVVAFALHLLGHSARVYDGSWSQWGSLEHTTKHTIG